MLTVTAILAVSGATWIHAQHQRTSSMPSAEDYLEIQLLYYPYAHDVHPGSEWNAAWLYTNDGVFQASVQHFNGTVATVPLAARIVPTAEGTRGSGYMLQIQKRQQDGPIEIILFGTYADRLVKTRDGWRFKERIFRSDTLLVRPTSDGPKREPRKHDQRQRHGENSMAH